MKLIRIWRELTFKRRAQLFVAAVIMIFSTLSQICLIVSVMPFISVLVEPSKVWNASLAAPLKSILNLNHPSQVLLPISFIFGFLAIVSGSSRLLSLWVNGQLAAVIGADLSDIAFQRTLAQPYNVHIQRNSSEVIVSLRQVDNIVNGILAPLLQALACAITIIATSITVVLVNWQATIFAVSFFGGLYIIIAYKINLPLRRNGENLVFLFQRELQTLQESLNGIRDVLIDGTQEVHQKRFRNQSVQIKLLNANNNFLQSFPRFVIEPIGYGFLAIAGFNLAQSKGSVADTLPLLAVFAIAAQTFLPNLQQLFSCWGSIKSSKGSLAHVITLLDQPCFTSSISSLDGNKWNHAIQFCDVFFRYKNDSPDILRGVNFLIHKGERIGVVGSTGSGKSTLIDLIMGLLDPTAGSIVIDGITLGGTLWTYQSWRSQLAHVPQNIFLSDSSIAANIALGSDIEDIDFECLKIAASQAQLLPFISSLPHGFSTYVGESGIRLSGGQRQRIGIARALYKKSTLLILDEATSALDNSTEADIISTINSLDSSLTVISVAHRLTTIRNCDRIMVLSGGLIVGFDTHDALIRNCKEFRHLAMHKN